jgi:hypothetical protein
VQVQAGKAQQTRPTTAALESQFEGMFEALQVRRLIEDSVLFLTSNCHAGSV